MMRRLLSDDFVERRYFNAGADVGDARSYLFMGEPSGFESIIKKWARWERRYAERGYRTISLDDFTMFGGYGQDISDKRGQLRGDGEEPVFYAVQYLEER